MLGSKLAPCQCFLGFKCAARTQEEKSSSIPIPVSLDMRDSETAASITAIHIKQKLPKAKEGVECAAWPQLGPSQWLQVSHDHCPEGSLSALSLAVAASFKVPSAGGFLPDFCQVYRLQLEQIIRREIKSIN